MSKRKPDCPDRAGQPCVRCQEAEDVTLAQTERGSVPLCPDCRPRWEVWRDTTGGTWSDWRRRWTS